MASKLNGRLILHAPYYWITLGKTPSDFLVYDFGTPKYGWILDLIKEGAIEYAILVDPNVSSLDLFTGSFYRANNIIDEKKRYEFAFMEAIKWGELNDIDCDGKLITLDQIKSGDIVFGFANQFLDGHTRGFSDEVNILEKAISKQDVFSVIHLSHFIFGVHTLANNIRRLKPDLLIHEMPLHESNFFRGIFGPEVIVNPVPWVVQERFKPSNGFKSKDQKILVAGAISPQSFSQGTLEIFFNFGCENLAPNRHLLFKYKEQLAHLFDFSAKEKFNVMMDRIRSKWNIGLPEWEKYLSGNISAQLKDSSQKYPQDNAKSLSSKRYVYAEHEITGSPTISYFEALTSGCVLLSPNGWVEKQYNLKPNINFLEFDGTIKGLISAANFCESTNGLGEFISNNNSIRFSSCWSKSAIQDLFVNMINDKLNSKN